MPAVDQPERARVIPRKSDQLVVRSARPIHHQLLEYPPPDVTWPASAAPGRARVRIALRLKHSRHGGRIWDMQASSGQEIALDPPPSPRLRGRAARHEAELVRQARGGSP